MIIGLSAIVAGQTLQLDWRPLARDCTFYAYSIVLLVLVVHDGKVEWFEALAMFLSYGLYIGFMYVRALLRVAGPPRH